MRSLNQLLFLVSKMDRPMITESEKKPRIESASNRGFSLVELLIVVMIILVLAAMAVPSYLGARSRANEASAVASVRVMIEAQNLYRNTVGSYTTLNGLSGEYLNDTNLAAGKKSGYYFGTEAIGNLGFTATAMPLVFVGRSCTGHQGYYGDQTNVIRMRPSDDGTEPNSTSPALQ